MAQCRELSIPCAIVRVISDGYDADLPLDFNRVLRADDTLSVTRLVGALIRSPGSMVGFARLSRQMRMAAGRLAEVLLRIEEQL
jgi:hypothetical protein